MNCLIQFDFNGTVLLCIDSIALFMSWEMPYDVPSHDCPVDTASEVRSVVICTVSGFHL